MKLTSGCGRVGLKDGTGMGMVLWVKIDVQSKETTLSQRKEKKDEREKGAGQGTDRLAGRRREGGYGRDRETS